MRTTRFWIVLLTLMGLALSACVAPMPAVEAPGAPAPAVGPKTLVIPHRPQGGLIYLWPFHDNPLQGMLGEMQERLFEEVETLPGLGDEPAVRVMRLREGETVSALKTPIRDNLIVELTIVPVRGKGLMVAVMRDITEQEKARASLAHLRSETLERTQAVIKKQMRVAHEIAGLLGETTAETKVLLSELRRLMQEDSGSETTG